MHRVAWSAPPGTDWNKVRTHLCALLLLSVGAAYAQVAPCTVVVDAAKLQLPRELTVTPWPPPANGYGYPPALPIPLRGLSSESFVVRDGERPVPVLSVDEDTGPRRIALVVVLDSRWRRVVHGGLAEAPRTAVRAVLSSARPEDSFALLTAPGPRIAVPFGAATSELRARTTQLSPSQTPLGRAEAVLNALVEVADWFGRPQTGDSILLIGGFRKASRARVSQVGKILVNRGIRVFVFGAASDYMDCLPVCTEQTPDVTLALATGGTNQEVAYAGSKHPDESLRLWQNEAKSLYDMATLAYIVRLPSTGPRMWMRLSPGLGAHLAYPRPLPAGLAAMLNKVDVGAHLYYPSPLPVCP